MLIYLELLCDSFYGTKILETEIIEPAIPKIFTIHSFVEVYQTPPLYHV
jgi:hypothetical protein